MAVSLEREQQRFLKSVLSAHHFIENILIKSSAVPVCCLFVFACFFSFYGIFFFFASSYSMFLSPLQGTEQGQKMNMPKINYGI